MAGGQNIVKFTTSKNLHTRQHTAAAAAVAGAAASAAAAAAAAAADDDDAATTVPRHQTPHLIWCKRRP